MFRLACASAIAILTLWGGRAGADPDVFDVPEQTAVEPAGTFHRGDMEAGFFGGGFISNSSNQFYDDTVYSASATGPNQRPQMDTVNSELGGRFAYFLHPNFGVEAEASTVFAHVHDRSQEFAEIFGFGLSGILQRPMGNWTPYVAAGISLRHVASPDTVLGSDTDFPIHVGIGVRYWLSSTIALRADVRYLRGPSQGSGTMTDLHYTLNASYGEFSLGFAIRLN